MNSCDDSGTELEDLLAQEIEYIEGYLADTYPVAVVYKFQQCMDNLKDGGIHKVPSNPDDMFAAVAECDKSCKNCIEAIASAHEEIHNSFHECIELIRQISEQ